MRPIPFNCIFSAFVLISITVVWLDLLNFLYNRLYRKNIHCEKIILKAIDLKIKQKLYALQSLQGLSVHSWLVPFLRKKWATWQYKSPFFNLILSMPIMRKHLEIPNFQLNVCILLTANIFESGPMPTPWNFLAGPTLLPS